MSEDNKARIREFLDRVLTAGEINATGDYFHEHAAATGRCACCSGVWCNPECGTLTGLGGMQVVEEAACCITTA